MLVPVPEPNFVSAGVFTLGKKMARNLKVGSVNTKKSWSCLGNCEIMNGYVIFWVVKTRLTAYHPLKIKFRKANLGRSITGIIPSIHLLPHIWSRVTVAAA